MREDLTPSQQAVQCSHAAIEATNLFNLGNLPDHPHIVLLGAKNESKLHRVTKYLFENKVKFVHFYESDLDHQLTAIATEPIGEFDERRLLFRKYQLLKHDGGGAKEAA